MRQVGLILLLLVPACGGAVNSGPEKAGPVENVKGTIAPLQTLDLTRQTLVYGVEFAQPLAQVWQALLSARETVGMALAEADEGAGLAVYRFEGRNRKLAGQDAADYVDCGMGPTGPRATSYRLSIRLTSRVAAAGSMTRFTAELHATATHPGTSSDTIDCSSTGVLEKRVVGFVAAQLD